MAYWATETVSLGTWQTGGSMLSSGLSWREAIPAVCESVPQFTKLSKLWLLTCLLLGRSWISLHICTYGTQRSDWCRPTYPILCHRSVFIWILLRLFLCHFSCSSGNVLAWHSYNQRVNGGDCYDSSYLAIVCECREPHCQKHGYYDRRNDKVCQSNDWCDRY